MAKKFDTNPLDPSFPERVKEKGTTPLGSGNGHTRQFADPAVTEEQTRRFNEAEYGGFDPMYGNEGYQPAPLYKQEKKAHRSLMIGNISLPENILTALPYIPFSIIGLVAGIIELIFIPKSEPKVRYHAAQGVAAQLAIWIVSAILGAVAFGSDFVSTAGWIFSFVTTIMLLVFAFKAWQGKPIHIESVESLTDWLEEKIKPQN
jgi:uncharacterized membrane protein